MSLQTYNSLGMKQIFELIEAPGEFLYEVKSHHLKRTKLKNNELRDSYARLQSLLDILAGNEAKLRNLRDLYAHIPKYEATSASTHIFALHELFLLKQYLYHYGRLRSYLRQEGHIDLFPLPDLSALFALLDPEGSGMPAFRLYPAYSIKLSDLLNERQSLSAKLQNARLHLLNEARSELQIPELKEEFTFSRSNAPLAERLLHSRFYVLSSESVANYSFILADDEYCLDLKKQLTQLCTKLEKEEERILKELSHQVHKALPELRDSQQILMQGAWRFLLADFALKYGCCLPKLVRKRSIRVKGAVNLPLKLHLEDSGRKYQSLDYDFDHAISLLTGPNMGGKTTILKTLGQLCWMARLGIPLPCKTAELPILDHIWYNQDDATSSADLSSFGREVVAFTEALQQEGSTLFLLDEFARGTNPSEGELLASSVLRHLATTQHMCVAATHFTAPAMLEDLEQYSIAGLDADAPALRAKLPLSPTQRLKALGEAMDYRLLRLKKHQAPPQSAVRVARILGLPEAILRYLEEQ